MTIDELYKRLSSIHPGAVLCTYTKEKVEQMLPLINEINERKKDQDTVILAHSYVAPEIVLVVADYTGDSFKLSEDATKVTQKTILFSAVRFMGETAKILNPEKDVLIPGPLTGCSLADSITGEQVRKLREQHPDYTFVCYINTTAAVKAACDVCVTSGNVMKIVESLPTDKICFVPDKLMGENIKSEMEKRGVKKDFILHDGCCYLTECGLNARMHYEHPDMEFIGSCSMCKYMKSNSLENILETLRHPEKAEHVDIDEPTRVAAKKCIDAMFHYANL